MNLESVFRIRSSRHEILTHSQYVALKVKRGEGKDLTSAEAAALGAFAGR